MRRVLRAVIQERNPGDITTIEDEGSVEEARQALAPDAGGVENPGIGACLRRFTHPSVWGIGLIASNRRNTQGQDAAVGVVERLRRCGPDESPLNDTSIKLNFLR